MKRINYILNILCAISIICTQLPLNAQTPSPPQIDTPLTIPQDYFYNAPITVPYSNGEVGIFNNAAVEIHSTSEVTLLPGFIASTDSGCGEFVAGIRECQQVLISTSIKDVSCFDGWDGEVTIQVSGGYPPYHFFWEDINTEYQRKQLKAGSYTVEIIDSVGCLYTDSFVISQPDLIDLSIVTTPSICQETTGTAEAVVSGGSLVYDFYWSNGITDQDALEQLPSGEYNLTVIDTNHCVAFKEFEISDINGPELFITITDSVTCSGYADGEAFVEIGSGNSPFTCLWHSNSDTGIVSSRLRGGQNLISVTDNNGCMSYSMFYMPAPEPMSISITATSTNCGLYTGELTANVSGGSGMYSYYWSSGSTDSLASGLGAGFDTITVTDGMGCVVTEVGMVESMNGPEFNITVLNHVSCFGNYDGKATIDVINGIPPYAYLWSIDSLTSKTVDYLPAGEFILTVTDSNNCSARKKLYIDEPEELVVAFYYQSPGSDSAMDGKAEAHVYGGVPPYNYYWVNTGKTTRSVDNLGIGTETLIVTDATGCQAQDQRNIVSSSSTCYRTNIPACPPIVPGPSCTSSPCVLNIVTDFQADPTGTVNSQCAFEAAADFFNARNGNGTLVIPAGNYLVGKQVPLHPPYTAQHPFWNTGNDVLCFVNCANFTIEGQLSSGKIASKIKFEDCLMYGMFDTTTGERYIADSPGGPMGCGLDSVNRNYHKIATPGNFLVLTECQNVTVKYLEADGNSDHLSYGGHYCDGIQVPASGILMNGSSRISINSVEMHHFGLDGIQIYELDLFSERRYLDINISNSKFNWNGRVGLHWNSGRRVNVVGCEFNYNALARFESKAADGLDFENDGRGAPVELGNFVNCDFLFNSYAGIECNPEQGKKNRVRDMTFTSCNFASGENIKGTSYAAIPGGKNFDFRKCNFYGSIIHAHHARITRFGTNNDNVKFRPIPGLSVGCTFNEEFRSYSMNADSLDECYTGLTNTIDHSWLLSFNAARVLFQNCVINSNRQMRLINVGGGSYYSPHNYAVFENCNLSNHGLTGTTNVGSVYAVDIRNSNLNVRTGWGQNISYNGFVIGQFNRQAILDEPVPFCKPKYRNPPYPDRVMDAYNCAGCVTRKPPFCPEDTSQGCNPCTKLQKPVYEEMQPSGLSVHPNPSNNKIQISNIDVNSELKIYSILGDCLFTTFNKQEILEIDISKYKTGIYILENGRSGRGKFLKTD